MTNASVLSFSKLICFQRVEFDGFQVINQFARRHSIPHSSPFMRAVIQHFPKSFPHFLISLLAERQFTDGLGSWRVESGIQKNKSLQRRIGLEVADEVVEIVGQSPYYT